MVGAYYGRIIITPGLTGLIETLSNFRTIEMLNYPIPTNACFRLVQIQRFYIPPSFPAFHIPLIFAR